MSCAVGDRTVGRGTERGAVVAQQGNEEQRLPPRGPEELRNVDHETSPEQSVGFEEIFCLGLGFFLCQVELLGTI